MPLSPGQVLNNRYRIVKLLGQGGFGAVYKAFDPRIDRYLAVKVLREQFARDVTSRQRFLREARAAGGLGHPAAQADQRARQARLARRRAVRVGIAGDGRYNAYLVYR